MRQLEGLYIGCEGWSLGATWWCSLGDHWGDWGSLVPRLTWMSQVGRGTRLGLRRLRGVQKGSKGVLCAPFQHCCPPRHLLWHRVFFSNIFQTPHDSPTGLFTLAITQQTLFFGPFRHSKGPPIWYILSQLSPFWVLTHLFEHQKISPEGPNWTDLFPTIRKMPSGWLAL